MDENFLLPTRACRRLYYEYARGMPIYDFHCHLPAREIAENRKFENIAEAWLGGDHYKWRAMRANGVPERLITGDASDKEKFLAWAHVVPSTIGNPLYHWTHLELKRCFGISGRLLSADTAEGIYKRCAELLSREEYRVRGLLGMMNVHVVCTTDDPIDSLEHHARLREDPSFPITVVPTWRPDAALKVEDPPAFNSWVDNLSRSAGVDIKGWSDLLAALQTRHDFFLKNGCRASDQGIEEPYAEDCTEGEAQRIFVSVRGGATPDVREARAYKSALMRELARMDAKSGWVMQLHMGALRNVSARSLRGLGPNMGFDTVGDFSFARPLARFLDRLESDNALPKTILYALNPSDNPVLASMIGCFPRENVRGAMQFGPAWWFNDQQHGMEDQMRVLADMGLLARFVGMVTDSRCFLSYPRHEYFRRVLCRMLGSGMDRGEIPGDFDLVGGIVRDICWNNANEYFAIPLKEQQHRPR